MEIKIVCEDEKYMPAYANETDACMDLKVRIPQGCYSYIEPKTTAIYGTGIKCSIPKDHVMLVFPRSSTGIKLHCMLSNTTGVIDSGYRDEIKMAITNFGDRTVELEDGQRVAQFMIIPRPKLELVTVADDEEFRNGDRGGGIGSSGKY